MGLVRSITLYRKLKMAQKSKKKKLRKDQLPPKADLLSGKPIKKYNSNMNIFNSISPIREDQGQYDGLTWREKKRKK